LEADVLTHLPFDLAVLATAAKFLHVVVVGGLLVVAYRWSRRGSRDRQDGDDHHRASGELGQR
jgi:hypothetical protein